MKGMSATLKQGRYHHKQWYMRDDSRQFYGMHSATRVRSLPPLYLSFKYEIIT